MGAIRTCGWPRLRILMRLGSGFVSRIEFAEEFYIYKRPSRVIGWLQFGHSSVDVQRNKGFVVARSLAFSEQGARSDSLRCSSARPVLVGC